MTERKFNNIEEVASNADFPDKGKVLTTGKGVAVPVSIHGGSSNGVVGFEVENGNVVLRVNVPPDGSGYRSSVRLSPEDEEKLKKFFSR